MRTGFVETFNRELTKLLFKLMDAQELQEPEQVSTTKNCEQNCEQNKQHGIVDDWYDA